MNIIMEVIYLIIKIKITNKDEEEIIIIEEYIIIIIEPGVKIKSKERIKTTIKIIYKKWIIKGNNVKEMLIEREGEGEGENIKKRIISQKEYILPERISTLLINLGIPISSGSIKLLESEEPKEKEENQERKTVLRGKNKKIKDKSKIEDKKDEVLTKKIVTHGGSSKGEKKGGSKKEDEKEESKSNNREGGNFGRK